MKFLRTASVREIERVTQFISPVSRVILNFSMKFLHYLHICRNDVSQDPDILKLVHEQTTQWTECMHRQRKEEWNMLKTHLAAQEELFKKLCSTVQVKQMKELEAFFVR